MTVLNHERETRIAWVRTCLIFRCHSSVCLQVDAFWVVTSSSDVVGYQHYGGPCCFHVQNEVNGVGFEVDSAVISSLHGVTIQKTTI